MTKVEAAKIAKAIAANVAALNAKRVTFEQFGTRNRALWDSVAQGEMNVMGSACDKRHMAVQTVLNRIL